MKVLEPKIVDKRPLSGSVRSSIAAICLLPSRPPALSLSAVWISCWLFTADVDSGPDSRLPNCAEIEPFPRNVPGMFPVLVSQIRIAGVITSPYLQGTAFHGQFQRHSQCGSVSCDRNITVCHITFLPTLLTVPSIYAYSCQKYVYLVLQLFMSSSVSLSFHKTTT